MRSGRCPKCEASNVSRRSNSKFQGIPSETLICAQCGFLEFYVDPGAVSGEEIDVGSGTFQTASVAIDAPDECLKCGARLTKKQVCDCGEPAFRRYRSRAF